MNLGVPQEGRAFRSKSSPRGEEPGAVGFPLQSLTQSPAYVLILNGNLNLKALIFQLQPHTSSLQPPTSNLQPHTSPHTSHLQPHVPTKPTSNYSSFKIS